MSMQLLYGMFIIIFLFNFFIVYLNCSINENFYSIWVEKYRRVSGKNNPPEKFKQWIKIAAQLKSSYDPEDYKEIFSHLAPFENMNLTIELMKNYQQKFMELKKWTSGRNMNEMIRFARSQAWPFTNTLSFLPQVLDPKVDFYTIIHMGDESMVFPSDEDRETPYTDMRDVFESSQEMRLIHSEYRDKCMLLQAPDNFYGVPYKIPVFSKNRLKGGKDILFGTLQSGVMPYNDQIQAAYRAPIWERKEAKAMFRGRTSGINFKKAREENYPLTNNPRFKLHEMSMLQSMGKLNCSVKLDFGITGFVYDYGKDEYMEEVKKKYPFVNFLRYGEQFKSKYMVVIDGHGWPDRIAFCMLSGSLVFLSTLHEDWVINQIQDGVHYIKVKPDLSDLVEKLEWAANNDAEAKRIASNGRKLASEKFGLSQIQVYNAFLFMEYQRLFEKKN